VKRLRCGQSLVSFIVYTSLLTFMWGCSSPKPILYPNAHYQTVGKQSAEHDIAECRTVAKEAGSSPGHGKTGQVAGSTVVGAGVGAASGAAGGAVVGAAGRGSAIGAVGGAVAGLLRGLFRPSRPSQAYMGVVDRCLKERGYDPVGWE
jgi:Glycine-zipper domain